MSEEIWNRLVEFTENEITPKTDAVLSRETRLVEDLGLIGDDADEFMGDFSKEFAVEGGDFEFSDYFRRKVSIWSEWSTDFFPETAKPGQ